MGAENKTTVERAIDLLGSVGEFLFDLVDVVDLIQFILD